MNTTFTQLKCIGTCCPDKIRFQHVRVDWQFQLFLGEEINYPSRVGPDPVINEISPRNGRKQMGNWGYNAVCRSYNPIYN